MAGGRGWGWPDSWRPLWHAGLSVQRSQSVSSGLGPGDASPLSPDETMWSSALSCSDAYRQEDLG